MINLKNTNYQSIGKVKTPKLYRDLMIILSSCLILLILSLFLPWRQTVTGTGKITIFSPMQRPQNINAMIDSKIKKWEVQEGEFVKRGQLLVEIEEVDEKFLDLNQLDSTEAQRNTLIDKRASIERMIQSLEGQIHSLKQLQNAAIPSAELEIKQSRDKQESIRQKYLAAEQNFKTAELNYDRRQQLFEKGLSSKRDLELAELAFIKNKSEHDAAKADLDIAQRSISLSQLGLNQVGAETALKIQEAETKLAEAFQKLADINNYIYKADIGIANLESRISQRKIFSPVDGQITSIFAPGSAEIIKAGTRLAVVVPESTDQAVELYISDHFAPLVNPGRKVRLQFSGFPALQFSGWPSIAIGTFAGKIAVVDGVSNQDNKYRVLIKPDKERIEEGLDREWPNSTILRAGANATGWIILDEVPIWFELWRIFNGFPPSLMTNPEKTMKRKIK